VGRRPSITWRFVTINREPGFGYRCTCTTVYSALSVIDGLIGMLTLGYVVTSLSLDYMGWHMNREFKRYEKRASDRIDGGVL